MAATVLLNELDGLGGEGDLDPGVEVALKVRLRAVLHQVALGLQQTITQCSTTDIHSHQCCGSGRIKSWAGYGSGSNKNTEKFPFYNLI